MTEAYAPLPAINPLLLLKYFTVDASVEDGVRILDLLFLYATSGDCPDQAKADGVLTHLAQMLPLTAGNSNANPAARDILDYLRARLNPVR
jgi:hypothetical protein